MKRVKSLFSGHRFGVGPVNVWRAFRGPSIRVQPRCQSYVPTSKAPLMRLLSNTCWSIISISRRLLFSNFFWLTRLREQRVNSLKYCHTGEFLGHWGGSADWFHIVFRRCVSRLHFFVRLLCLCLDCPNARRILFFYLFVFAVNVLLFFTGLRLLGNSCNTLLNIKCEEL